MNSISQRHDPSANYVIPCLLHDTETNVYIKAVILELGAAGCQIFTNDKRVRLMDRSLLLGKKFWIEFDFYDIPTEEVEVEVIDVKPGKDPDRERRLSFRFSKIDTIARRDINRIVRRDIQLSREKTPRASHLRDLLS